MIESKYWIQVWEPSFSWKQSFLLKSKPIKLRTFKSSKENSCCSKEIKRSVLFVSNTKVPGSDLITSNNT